jgi:hypothetical protein
VNTQEELLVAINDRLTAIGESVSEARLKALVATQFAELTADPVFARKMRFGGQGDKRLIGSKFSRWGLNQADIEFLYDLENALQGTQRSSGGVHQGPSEELTNTFKAISDAVYMTPDEVRAIDRTAIDNLFPRVTKQNRAQYEAAMRAMDTAETGYGLQLIGAQYVGDLWEAARADMKVANLIGSFEMTAPVAYLPVEVDFPTMYYQAESQTSSDSAYTTSKTGSNRVTVTAKKEIIHQMWSGEMEEDSIVPFIPFLRAQAQKSIAYHMDALALNGDETTTNGINGVVTVMGATSYFAAFDGIRHAALVDNTNNKSSAANAVIDLSHFRGAYGRMIDGTYLHDWGHPNNPNDLVHIVDPYTGDQMLGIDEFATQDKAGNQATIFNGQIAKVYNHPVIASIALKKAEATGFVDATTPADNVYGQMVTFNVNGCKWGWRRRIQMMTQLLPATDQTRIVYSLRLGFGRFTPTAAASGIEWADEVYYLSL